MFFYKISPFFLIIKAEVVYDKSAILRTYKIQPTSTGRFFTARHIRPTPTPGRQGAAPILDIRKGGYYKQQVSQKHRCNDNKHDLPHGSEPQRTRQPQIYRGQPLPRGNADHAGDSLAMPFRVRFSSSRPGKRTRNGSIMEMQLSEKCTCLNACVIKFL